MSFDAADYWEHRYARGGISGRGSRGAYAAEKAAAVNDLIATHDIGSVVDWGCGDGYLLSLLDVPDYLGVDVSPTVIGRNLARWGDRQWLRWDPASRVRARVTAELALSVDVLFHLTDDGVYQTYLEALFGSASRFVMVWAASRRANPGDRLDRHMAYRPWADDVATLYWRTWSLTDQPADGYGPWVYQR